MTKELEELTMKYKRILLNDGVLDYLDIENLAKKAYTLGRNFNNSKEENTNPYHIDYERQTKLDFDGME